MGTNGNLRPAASLPPGTIMISAGEMANKDGFSRIAFYGSVDGATLYHLELTSLGPGHVLEFVKAVAQVLEQRESRIVRP